MSKQDLAIKEALTEVRQEIRDAFAEELKTDGKALLLAADNRDAGIDTQSSETMVTYGQGQLTQGIELVRIMESVFKNRGI